MMKKSKFAMSVVLGLLLLGLAMFGLWSQAEPEVALAQFPTPQPFAFGGGEWVMVTYIPAATTVITPANVWYTATSGFQTAAYVLADVEIVLDVSRTGLVTNVVSCTLQFSNDNVNWCTAPVTIEQNMAADGLYCETVPLFGRYSRAACVAGEDDMYTVTVQAKLYN